jgi:hypothetical protein
MSFMLSFGGAAGVGVVPNPGVGFAIFALILSLAFLVFAVALLVFYYLQGARTTLVMILTAQVSRKCLTEEGVAGPKSLA